MSSSTVHTVDWTDTVVVSLFALFYVRCLVELSHLD